MRSIVVRFDQPGPARNDVDGQVRWHAVLAPLALLLLLAGCSRYQARPIEPAQLHAQWQARRLDDPALVARLRPMLPARDQGQWPPARYGRAELLLAAMALNPELAAARAQLAEASAAVTTARARPNPTLSLALERYTQAQVGSSPWLWGISTDFLLDSALRRRLRTRWADAGVRGARLDYAEAVWKLRQSLCAALVDVMLARRAQSLAEQAVIAASALQQGMQQRQTLGESDAADALQAARTLAAARGDVAAAAQRQVNAYARLAQAVGVPPEALRGLTLRWDRMDHPTAPDPDQLRRLSQRALLSRADLERALVDYDQREIELHQQVRAQYPQLSLGPGYTYDHGVRKLTFNASLSLPVFNQNQGPIAQAQARREVAGRQVLAVQARIDGQIKAATARLQLALQGLRAARAGQHVAERQLDRARRAEALGAADHLAVLDARLAALTAAQASGQALDQAWQAEATLEEALRVPLDPAENELRPLAAGDSP